MPTQTPSPFHSGGYGLLSPGKANRDQATPATAARKDTKAELFPATRTKTSAKKKRKKVLGKRKPTRSIESTPEQTKQSPSPAEILAEQRTRASELDVQITELSLGPDSLAAIPLKRELAATQILIRSLELTSPKQKSCKTRKSDKAKARRREAKTATSAKRATANSTQSFRISGNNGLQYKSTFQSQLEADVFFTLMDANIVSACALSYAHLRPMLDGTESHPFYASTTFARYAPRIYGQHYRFSHLEHDDMELTRQVGAKYPKAGKNLERLLTAGNQLSWRARDTIIRQYYLKSLPPADLHLLNVVHESGLALRALMRNQAEVNKFDDVALATISGSKIIKAVKYTRQEGALKYFSNLSTEIKQLEKIGMAMDNFSKTDLCGHIMDTFAAHHPEFRLATDWIRREAEAGRYSINIPNVRTTLLNTETRHGIHRNAARRPKAPTVHAALHASGPGTQRQPWDKDYPPHLIAKAVNYADARLKTRAPQVTGQVCSNCRPWPGYDGHDTSRCPKTLRRCFNGAVDDSTMCPRHPDGDHTSTACNGGAPRRHPTANHARTGKRKRRQRGQAPDNPATPAPVDTTAQATVDSILAMTDADRAAVLQALTKK